MGSCHRNIGNGNGGGFTASGGPQHPSEYGGHAQVVKPGNEPPLIRSLNNFENWDGNLGPGNLNAWACMERAIQLSRESGMADVSLRN